VPSISARRASTTVRLEPGEAVVLGGLIAERTLERERKVPLLGDIPVIGNLFKNKYEITQQTNVLFYIRPRILQGMDLSPDF
jgi:type II secretory pathway component GspD/PulD (secretin)